MQTDTDTDFEPPAPEHSVSIIVVFDVAIKNMDVLNVAKVCIKFIGMGVCYSSERVVVVIGCV